jgi:hypothetical protein
MGDAFGFGVMQASTRERRFPSAAKAIRPVRRYHPIRRSTLMFAHVRQDSPKEKGSRTSLIYSLCTGSF